MKEVFIQNLMLLEILRNIFRISKLLTGWEDAVHAVKKTECRQFLTWEYAVHAVKKTECRQFSS